MLAETDRRKARLPPRRPSHGAVRRRPRPQPLRPAPNSSRVRAARSQPPASAAVRDPRPDPRPDEAALRPLRLAARHFLAAAAWIVGARPTVRGGPLDGRDPADQQSRQLARHPDSRRLDGDRLRFEGQSRPRRDPLARRPECDALRQPRRPQEARRIRRVAIARAAERDQPITLFPEGTTGPGDELLPFRSSLLEAAVLCVGRRRVRPLALDYGEAATRGRLARRERQGQCPADSRPQGHAAGDRAFASAARPH